MTDTTKACYVNVIEAVTRATSAAAIDSTAKLSWNPDRIKGSGFSREERLAIDVMVHARLHHALDPALWDALMARYSSSTESKAASLQRLLPEIVSPADERFTRYAAIAWAFPKPKGEGKRSTPVLPAIWYDFNHWDEEGRSDTTRRRWNKTIRAWLDAMVNLGLIEAQHILDAEGLLVDRAA
ncbi:hypothetical protein D9M69_461840 [compost metagenome]